MRWWQTHELPRPRTAARVVTGPGQAHVDDEAKGHIRKFGQVTPGETNPHVSELSHRRIKSGSGFCAQRDGDQDAVQGKPPMPDNYLNESEVSRWHERREMNEPQRRRTAR